MFLLVHLSCSLPLCTVNDGTVACAADFATQIACKQIQQLMQIAGHSPSLSLARSWPHDVSRSVSAAAPAPHRPEHTPGTVTAEPTRGQPDSEVARTPSPLSRWHELPKASQPPTGTHALGSLANLSTEDLTILMGLAVAALRTEGGTTSICFFQY